MQSLRDDRAPESWHPPGAEPRRAALRPRSGRVRRTTRYAAWLRQGALALVTGASVTLALLYGPKPAEIAVAADQALARHGLGVTQVEVSGFERALPDDIFAAVATSAPVSILSYDTHAARRRLEGLAWIERADVSRVLPGRLVVRLTERRPFAVWQHRQMLFVMDREGRMLEPVAPSDYPGLPSVVGAGAASVAADLLRQVEGHPEIARRFETAIRIADRRWNIRLKGGPELLLPDSGEAEALALASRLQAEDRLLDRAVTSVDLRIPGKLTVTLVNGAREHLATLRRQHRGEPQPAAATAPAGTGGLLAEQGT